MNRTTTGRSTNHSKPFNGSASLTCCFCLRTSFARQYSVIFTLRRRERYRQGCRHIGNLFVVEGSSMVNCFCGAFLHSSSHSTTAASCATGRSDRCSAIVSGGSASCPRQTLAVFIGRSSSWSARTTATGSNAIATTFWTISTGVV